MPWGTCEWTALKLNTEGTGAGGLCPTVCMGCTCVSEGCQAAHSMRCCWGESALTECLRAVPSAAAAWVCALGGCFLGVAHGAGTRVRPSWVLPMEQAPGCVLLGCRPWSRHQGVSFLGVAYGAGTRVRPSWVSPMEQAPGCVLLGCRPWSRHQGASFSGVAYGAGTRVRPQKPMLRGTLNRWHKAVRPLDQPLVRQQLQALNL